jgi:hypothetical protein
MSMDSDIQIGQQAVSKKAAYRNSRRIPAAVAAG